jgi:hypothetical protein
MMRIEGIGSGRGFALRERKPEQAGERGLGSDMHIARARYIGCTGAHTTRLCRGFGPKLVPVRHESSGHVAAVIRRPLPL